MKRLTIDLRDETHKRLKVHCAIHDKDMAEVVRELIEEYLAKVEKKKGKI
jgi:plasmid stability protein